MEVTMAILWVNGIVFVYDSIAFEKYNQKKKLKSYCNPPNLKKITKKLAISIQGELCNVRYI
jgi:hypothetical protein